MDDFLRLSRIAFRRLHGMSEDSELLAYPADKDKFDIARRNRVLGLWANGLIPIESEWHRLACGQALHSARLTAEAERIYESLRTSVDGLRVIKGPALAAQAWPQPGLRSFDDIDFRCGKHSLPALTSGLMALGYRAEIEDVRRQENLWHYGWGISFRNSGGVIAEFNHRMFPPHYPWPARLTRFSPDLWSPQRLDQTSVECPVPALHLLISCVHAVWHGWERLIWLADIAGLLVRYENIFTEAENLTRHDVFIRRALRCACHAANRIFGPFCGVPEFDTKYDGLADQACELFVRQEPDVSLYIQRQIHHRLMSPQEALLYTARRIATPGDPDFQRWSFSDQFRFLYWIFRPFRCVKNAFCR